MFMLFSLVFDAYKKSCMYLAYSEYNLSPETFEKMKKILTFLMIFLQLTLGIGQICFMVGYLRAASREINDIYRWDSA